MCVFGVWVCVLVCLCSVLVALCVSITIWTCVCLFECVRGIVCLHPSSIRLHFPKQGVFSAADNNVPSH